MRRPRRRHEGPAAPLEVILYGRPGCHLCEQAAAMIAEIGKHMPLSVHELNIEDDDALLRRYAFEIPVVVAGGVEIARAPIHKGQLEQGLVRAFARGGSS